MPCPPTNTRAAHLVNEANVGVPAALRLLHEVGVAALLDAKQVDVQHMTHSCVAHRVPGRKRAKFLRERRKKERRMWGHLGTYVL